MAQRPRGASASSSKERERAASRRQRRLLAALGVGGVLLAAMAGVTAYAVAQRGDARSQARKAQARQLDSAAVSQLAIDPELSLLLAREAARAKPGHADGGSIRTAFIFSQAARHASLRGTGVDGALQPGRQADPHGERRREGAGLRLVDARPARSFDHGAPVLDAAISPDGAKVLTGGRRRRRQAVGRGRGRQVLATFRHGAPVRTASFDEAGRMLYRRGRQREVWRTDGGSSHDPVGQARDRRVLQPGRRLVIVLGDDTSRGSTTRRPEGSSEASTRAVTSRAPSSVRAGGLLVTTGANETARIWRVRDGKIIHELKGHRGSVLDAAFSPGESRLATASADGTGRIWDVRTGYRCWRRSSATRASSNAVAFNPDGNFVVTGSTDLTARVSKAEAATGVHCSQGMATPFGPRVQPGRVSSS